MSDPTPIFPEALSVCEGAPIAMSRETGKLFQALAKAQAEIKAATKDAVNPHFKSKFADLASIWDVARDPLTKHGLSVLQPARADGQKATVTTILGHESGQWIAEPLTMTAQQNTPQGIGSCITYARRYGLAAMIGIVQDDDDGESAMNRSAAPQGKQEAAQPKAAEQDLLKGVFEADPVYTGTNDQKTLVRDAFKELGIDTGPASAATLMKKCSARLVEAKVPLKNLKAAVKEFLIEVKSA